MSVGNGKFPSSYILFGFLFVPSEALASKAVAVLFIIASLPLDAYIRARKVKRARLAPEDINGSI